MCVPVELSRSADRQPERSRVLSELHSRQEEDDEAVHIQDDFFHLIGFQSSSLFLRVIFFLTSSTVSSLAFNFSSDLPRLFLNGISRMLTRMSGVVNHGSGAQVGKAIEPPKRRVATQSGWMEAKESQSSEGRQTLAREDPLQRAGCDDQGRRRKRNVQCSAEGVGQSAQCPRSSGGYV